MLSKLYKLLWDKPSPKMTLAEILKSWDNREALLGVQRVRPTSPDQIQNDMDRLIRYSQSSDYAVWAQEVWADLLSSMDKLADLNLSDSDISFHRGKLRACLDHLRISYRARSMKEKFAEDQERLKRK